MSEKQTVKVFVGETLQINVSEPASAGYRWDTDDVNASEIVEIVHLKTESNKKTIGGSINLTWGIRGIKPGEIIIRLKRPWTAEDVAGVMHIVCVPLRKQ